MDPILPFEKALAISKQLTPRFIPDSKGKAYYSDMNFDLLGKIIEHITGMSIVENFETYIYKPLGLNQTYMFEKNMEYDFPGTKSNKNGFMASQLL